MAENTQEPLHNALLLQRNLKMIGEYCGVIIYHDLTPTQLPSDGPYCTQDFQTKKCGSLTLSKYLSVGENVKPFAQQCPMSNPDL